MFIFIIQLLQNLKSVHNAFSNPFADCDISTRSSAYRMQFTVEPWLTFIAFMVSITFMGDTESDGKKFSKATVYTNSSVV